MKKFQSFYSVLFLTSVFFVSDAYSQFWRQRQNRSSHTNRPRTTNVSQSQSSSSTQTKSNNEAEKRLRELVRLLYRSSGCENAEALSVPILSAMHAVIPEAAGSLSSTSRDKWVKAKFIEEIGPYISQESTLGLSMAKGQNYFWSSDAYQPVYEDFWTLLLVAIEGGERLRSSEVQDIVSRIRTKLNGAYPDKEHVFCASADDPAWAILENIDAPIAPLSKEEIVHKKFDMDGVSSSLRGDLEDLQELSANGPVTTRRHQRKGDHGSDFDKGIRNPYAAKPLMDYLEESDVPKWFDPRNAKPLDSMSCREAYDKLRAYVKWQQSSRANDVDLVVQFNFKDPGLASKGRSIDSNDMVRLSNLGQNMEKAAAHLGGKEVVGLYVDVPSFAYLSSGDCTKLMEDMGFLEEVELEERDKDGKPQTRQQIKHSVILRSPAIRYFKAGKLTEFNYDLSNLREDYDTDYAQWLDRNAVEGLEQSEDFPKTAVAAEDIFFSGGVKSIREKELTPFPLGEGGVNPDFSSEHEIPPIEELGLIHIAEAPEEEENEQSDRAYGGSDEVAEALPVDERLRVVSRKTVPPFSELLADKIKNSEEAGKTVETPNMSK